MRRIVLLLMVLVVGVPRLHAQSYSADAEALATRFESLVSQMSAAQQTRESKSIEVMRENIKNIRARAATLEDLRTKIAAAKDRVTVARQEAETAMIASERAAAAVATRASNYVREREQFSRDARAFFQRWRLPESGIRNAESNEEIPQFNAEKAPLVQRELELDGRRQQIDREETHAEALASFTGKKVDAAEWAEKEVARLESSQETRGVEFEQILTRNTNNLSRFAGLTSFPQNTARPSPGDEDMKPLLRKPPGTNTNALEQLHAQGARAANNCFDSSCEAVPMPRDNGAVQPVPVPQKVENHPAYQKATQAVAEAEQRWQEADAKLRAAQRAGRPAEEQMRLTNDATRLKGVELMEKFKLKSQVGNVSYSVDVSSKAPKAAGPGSNQ